MMMVVVVLSKLFKPFAEKTVFGSSKKHLLLSFMSFNFYLF